MFQLTSLTKTRCLDVRVLSQKDRKPDEQPGAQLLLQATLGVGVLAMFDGFLPGMLYRKPATAKQGEIEGLESAELTEIGAHVKRLPWQYEQTGCRITIDYGRGGSSNIVLDDVKVHRVSLRPDQKGVVIQWTADAPALNDTMRGKLTGLKSTDIQLTLVGPEVEDDAQGKIPGTGDANGKSSGKASKAALDASPNNPFPKDGAKSDEQVRNDALANGKPADGEPAKGRRKVVGASVE